MVQLLPKMMEVEIIEDSAVYGGFHGYRYAIALKRRDALLLRKVSNVQHPSAITV